MDYPEELEEFDYGQDFEDKYADEFDALNELEDDLESPIPSLTTKRRLDFNEEAKESNEAKLQRSEDHPVDEPAKKRPRTDSSDEVYLDNLIHESRASQDANKYSTIEISNYDLATTSNCSVSREDDHRILKKVATTPSTKVTVPKQVRSKPKYYESISVTTFDGSTFHVRLKDEVELLDTSIVKRKANLLSVPYSLLHAQALQLLEQKAKFVSTLASAPVAKTTEVQSSLWVEKFKPKQFTELLSDDGINRALLSWLKLWDKVVFNREAPKKVQKQPEFGKPKFQEVIRDLDAQGRPQQKFALLCGPPGLGKTTLAYIIARHAGYNPVELNASDDRSPEVFKRQLEASTQMRSVMGQDPRPNCLIIDEIDGAPVPAINVLITFAKNVKKSVLLRPVICICNDLYTPSLRPLRQVSFVLMFPPTCSVRLASRLYEISRIQNLKTDRGTLTALCEKAENDIRSCLSTIQFLHNIKQELRLRDVKLASIGQKDSHISMFTVWQQVFKMPRPNPRRGLQPGDDENESTSAGRFAKVLRLTHSCGEYEKILQGLFENYLNVNYRDLLLQRTSLGADWLCFANELQHVISSTQVYSVLPYVPYTVVAFHFLFAVLSNVNVTFPTQQFEFKTNLTKHENSIAALLQDMSPLARSSLNSQEIVLNFLPNLMQIVQPPLRPVNTQLYSAKEKMELRHVIDTMAAYNLHYRQERNLQGSYEFVLDPNVDAVISFPGLKPVNTLTYSSKQLISRELELEQMRRSERSNPNAMRVPMEKKMLIPNHQQVLKPKIVVVEKPIEERDFFGRKVAAVEKKDEKKSVFGNVWFRFKEGYTNAVRKTLYMRDLV